MKIKRNTISALILGCVLSANMALYANTVSQTEISGSWSAQTTNGTTATAFSSSNLTSSSGTVTSPLGDISVSEREIDYTFSYVDGVMYSEDPNGNIQETWGYIEDVEISGDEIYSDTLTDADGNYLVIGYDNITYTYNSIEITRTAYETYFVPKYEDYIVISGATVDLDLSATAIDGDAIALDLTETATDGTTSTGSLSDEYTVEYSDISSAMNGEINADLVDTVTGYMKINASATATGGDATALLGDITHSYLTINGENGVVYYKGANGDLTLNLTATATATYDGTTEAWTGGKAVGLDGTLDSQVGYSDVNIVATANQGTATGVSGDITIGSGDVYIVADANDIAAHVDDVYNVETLPSTAATAVAGTATFAGTTADLRAYSDSATATAATTLVATSGANVTLVASSATATAVGASSATLTNSTLTASASGLTATGVTDLTATNSDISVGVSATSTTTTAATATGASSAKLMGDTSLSVSVSSDATAVGIGTLTAAYSTGDDLDVSVYVKGVTATAVNSMSEVFSNDLTLNLTAVAIGDSEAATATAINSAVSFNKELDSSSSYTKTQELKGNISASASAEDATATATAINGAVGEDGEDLIISANISAYAETTGENAGDATAIAIDGDVYADITGSISAAAVGSTATGISGDITGDISGSVSASASSTADSDSATATAIDGEIDGTISGNISATASATGTDSNATAIAIDTDSTSLVFDGATISASASSESGDAIAYAIDASGALTVSGDVDVYGDVNVGGAFEVESGVFSQMAGNLTADSITVNTQDGGEFSFSFNTEGELSTVSTDSLTYNYNSTTSSVGTVLEGVLKSTAAALVGDSDYITDMKFIDVESEEAETSLSEYLSENDASVDVEGTNSLDYTLSIDDGELTATVTKTTYFQDKATTSNSATLGAALDAIVAKVDVVEETPSAVVLAATVEETSSEAEIWNEAAREMKVAVDGMNLDSFIPYTNSFIAQANAESYANLNLANIWRMRSLMDKTAKTARELAAEAIRNNPAYDGIDPDPITKPKRVAQFQSVNVIASRDGGANAPDYDFISTGGTADIDLVLTRDLLVGVGLGGIYNKVDGSSSTGTAESTSAIINAYAMYALESFDIFATIGYAHGFNESSKSTTEGTAKAEWDSDSIYHAAGFSYRIDFKNGIILRPMAMYNLVFQNYGKSKTSGGGNYDTSTSSESYINFKTYLGGELIYRIDKNLEIIARAFWTHEFADNSYDLTYSNALTSPYIGSVAYDGEDADRDSFLLGLGVAYKFNKAVSAYLDYNANISSDYLGHNLNAAIQMKF